MPTKQPNSAIVYRGPSLLTGKDVVVIATGLGRKSANGKTGAMVQTWILDATMNPVDAVKRGKDDTVCGQCKHRGTKANRLLRAKERRQFGRTKTQSDRSCYVTVIQAPNAIWKAFKAGRYQRLQSAWIKGRTIRIGSYGDPAAVPAFVWRELLEAAGVEKGRTGYTHQWRNCDVSLQSLLMASVDTKSEALEAVKAGWRYFRVRDDMTPLMAGEISCPASAEMGHRVVCADCTLCQGTSIGAKSIAILPHGTAGSAIIPLKALRAGVAIVAA